MQAADTWYAVETGERAQGQAWKDFSESSYEADKPDFRPGSMASCCFDGQHHDAPSSSVSCEGSPLCQNSCPSISQQR